jgi:hypothetical protein
MLLYRYDEDSLHCIIDGYDQGHHLEWMAIKKTLKNKITDH